MASVNLQIADILASQDQKEVTANQQINLLDKAMNTSVTISGISGDFDLTTTQSREAGLVILDGTPGADFNVDFPDANERRLAFFNNTDAAAVIRSSAETGDTVEVSAGAGVIVHYDGSNVYSVGGAGAGTPEQVEHHETGTPSISSPIFKKVSVREFSLEVDMAGSEGHADTAPSSDTDFDVLRNDVIVGAISFASGVKTATFSTIADRVLAVTFDGADAATSAQDFGPSNRTLTFLGNAQLDTAQKKFGTASLLLDGTGDAVSVPDSDDWAFGTGEFTVHGWVRFASLTGNQSLVSHYDANGNQRGWIFRYDGGNDQFRFISTSDGSTFNTAVVSSVLGLATGTWYHFAVDRDAGGNVRLYLDGTQVANTAMGSTIFNASTDLLVGALRTSPSSALGEEANAHVDEVEIIKGHALWGGAFTAPELGVEKDYRTWPIGTRLQIDTQGAVNGIADIALSLAATRVAA